MKTVQISLNSIDKVKSFVNAITQYEFDFDLISGRYVIDAKSIMGIFSLDLSKPIDLAIHGEDNTDEIMETLKPYLEPQETSPCGFFVPFRSVHPTALKAQRHCLNDFQQRRATISFYPSTRITSTVSIAACIRSSIFSSSFFSSFFMTFKLGFVTGCFATKIVQQSSYGRIDVS